MKGQGELAISLGHGSIQAKLFQALRSAPKTDPQSGGLICITQAAEQTADIVPPPASRPNNAQSSAESRAPRLHILKQLTLELAAISGPVGVDAAMAAVVSGARLDKVRIAKCGLRNGRGSLCFLASPATEAQRQAKRLQFSRVVAWLQLDVRKDDAIAT